MWSIWAEYNGDYSVLPKITPPSPMVMAAAELASPILTPYFTLNQLFMTRARNPMLKSLVPNGEKVVILSSDIPLDLLK